MSQKSGPGWVRGTGRRDCPVGYPIKGNEPSNLYYEPGDPGYPQVIPEMCFEDTATAEKVGFSHVVGHGAGAAPAAAAAAPAFLRQTGGGRTCPDGYPIKGNEPSNIFYRPEDPGYAQVAPEVCFKDVSEAEKAGFTRVKVEATKRTEPVAPVRKEEAAAAAAGAAAGAGAAKAVDAAKSEPVKAAEPARVAAPPPPPPPPPPPAPVAESSGGGWMKWLLPLIALAILAALIWYFTRSDESKNVTPTPPAATVAATTAAGSSTTEVAATVETTTGGAATVEAAAGGAATAVSGAAGTVEAAASGAGTAVSAAAGTVESAASAVVGTVQAVESGAGTAVTAAEGTVAASAAGAAESPVASPAASPVASPGASPAASGKVLNLEAIDIAFKPNELTMNASDEPVTIKMVNTGAAEHDFTIDSLKISQTVQPGKTVDIVIPAGTAPGTYDFYCNIPGHKEAGMVGKLIIK